MEAEEFDNIRRRGLELLGLAGPGNPATTTCVICGAGCTDAAGLDVICGICVSQRITDMRNRTGARRTE